MGLQDWGGADTSADSCDCGLAGVRGRRIVCPRMRTGTSGGEDAAAADVPGGVCGDDRGARREVGRNRAAAECVEVGGGGFGTWSGDVCEYTGGVSGLAPSGAAVDREEEHVGAGVRVGAREYAAGCAVRDGWRLHPCAG